MSDDKFTNPPLAPRPKEPETKQMPKVVVPESGLDAILREVRAVRAEVGEVRAETGDRLEKLKGTVGANHELTMHALDGIRIRVGSLETWRSDSEERQRKHSGGIAKVTTVAEQTSNHNLQQDAAIAQVIVRVDSVETKLDTFNGAVGRLLEVASKNRKTALAAIAIGAFVFEIAKHFAGRLLP